LSAEERGRIGGEVSGEWSIKCWLSNKYDYYPYILNRKYTNDNELKKYLKTTQFLPALSPFETIPSPSRSGTKIS